MSESKKIILFIIYTLILAFVFAVLDNGFSIEPISVLIQPIIFGIIGGTSIMYKNLRRSIIILSLILLILMIVVYLFNLFELANLIGSLGFGILSVTIATYIPDLIRKGFIEKY